MKTADYILIFLLIILIGVMIYVLYEIKTEGYKCLQSPLTYGADLFEKNYGFFDCNCMNGISFNKTLMRHQINYGLGG